MDRSHLGDSALKLALAARQLEPQLDLLRAEPIAVVGMACRFPGGARDLGAYWQLLRRGGDGIQESPQGRWDAGGTRDVAAGMGLRFGGFLDRLDEFDAQFFGIAPREARAMDPQQRLLLEVTWEALEDAGQVPAELYGTATGVFIGISSADYASIQMGRRDLRHVDAYFGTGNAPSVAAGRLAYQLGLAGPAMAVDTSCSSSLVALHLAAQSLRNRECELALAGGVNVLLAPETSVAFSDARMLAADGRCKTFDAAADGYVRGEGCGVVALMRLSDALARGYRVAAVVRGSAVNQDGASGGLTVPSGPAQRRVIETALRNAGLAPAQVSYVEAHGTGTPLGDPIEVGALRTVFGAGRAAGQPLWVGSVKTNIGHLESAAGIAGLIKVVLALENAEIPPHLHFRTPNPHIPWDEVPIAVPTAPVPWTGVAGRRVAGVSSFGFSGTNAHVVLEQAPEPVASGTTPRIPVLALSARTEEALRELAGRYRVRLAEAGPEEAGEIPAAALAGRTHWRHRLAVVAGSAAETGRRLAAFQEGRLEPGVATGDAPREGAPAVAFLFTGQGSHYAGMGRSLYEDQPVFRQTLDACAGILRPHLDAPLLEALFGPDSEALLARAAVAQPAQVALQLGLADLWASWGVRPAAVLGHSLGEYAAASVAGLLGREEALALAARRGRGMESLAETGAMVSVPVSEEEALAVLEGRGGVWLAAVNGPRQVVLSGYRDEVERAAEAFRERGARTRDLQVSHAFHSPLVEPMMPVFGRALEGVAFTRPGIPFVSSVAADAGWDEVATPEYWREQVRRPVRYAAGVERLRGEHGVTLFLEIGPHPVLTGISREADTGPEACFLPSLRRGSPDEETVAATLAELYVRGVDLAAPGGRRLRLPAYPFQRQRFWIAAPDPGDLAALPTPGREEAQASPDGDTYAMEWLPAPSAPPSPAVRLPSPAEIESRVMPPALASISWPAFERYAGLIERLEELSVRYVSDALARLGLEPREPLPPAGELARRLGVEPRHTHLLEAMLRMLAEGGDPERVESGLPQELLREVPEGEAEISLLDRCGRSLDQVLRGACDPLDLLFGDGGALVERLYRDSPVSRVMNSLTRDALLALASAVPPGARLRILEIGAGTGGTTAFLLPALAAGAAEYVITDLSPALTARARERFAGYPFVTCRTLDVERDPETQGFGPQRFDVVVAANVLHATADVRRSLEHVHRLLAPGGVLLLLEGVRRLRWLDLVFGLTEGWWRSVGDENRGGYPLLDEDAWLALLEASGFPSRSVLRPADPDRGLVSQQALLVARREGPAADPSREWLLLADREGVGARLAAELEAAGDRCRTVYRTADGQASLPASWPGPATARRGVVHLWGLDETPVALRTGRSLESDLEEVCGSAVDLLRALSGDTPQQPPALYIVTRGAVARQEGDDLPGLVQSSLWALARVAAVEHPELRPVRIDLDPLRRGDEATRLAAELRGAEHSTEDQVAFRDGGRYVPRLRPAGNGLPGPRPAFRPDTSCLITGGLGGLGLQVARWLVQQGVRHLALIGRRAPTEEAAEAVRELERAGATVLTLQADVSREEEVARCLDEVDRALPPLRGVFHLAGIPDARLLAQQTVPGLREMWSAKAGGAWNLHLLTRGRPLDRMVFFSSSASLLPISGQGAYAAANAFLDALAHHRRALGLPGLAVNWGPWEAVGYAADPRLRRAFEHYDRLGIGNLPPARALEELEAALGRGNRAQLGVLRVDWRRLFQVHPASARLPVLADLARAMDEAGGEAQPPVSAPEARGRLGSLSEAEPSRREETLKEWIRGWVARALGSPVERLDEDEPLVGLGLDSLMAVELRAQVRSELGFDIPIARFFDDLSVRGLSSYLLQNAFAQPSADAPETGAAAGAEKAFPLSRRQQALWFLYTMAPTSAAYNLMYAVTLREDLDLPALRRAFDALHRRHEMLRTTYGTRNGQSCQITGETPTDYFTVIEASGWGREEVEELLETEADRPFDLERGPVLRVHLLTRGAAPDHVLLLTAHHIAADFWSLDVLIHDLCGLYAGGPTPEPPNSYRAFVQHEARMLESGGMEREWEYWRDRLQGPLPVLELPADRPRPAVQTWRGTSYSSEIDPGLAVAARDLARRSGVTPFMALLAVFEVVLAACSGQTELLVGTPTAGRPGEDWNRTVGYFANPVVLRADLSGNPDAAQLMARTRDEVLSALDHVALPFPVLVERLKLPRDPGRSPLFQVAFAWERHRLGGGDDPAGLKGLVLESLAAEQRGSAFDLRLAIFDEGRGFRANWQYSTDLFDSATIARLDAHFQTVLGQVVADPGRPVGELSLLTEAERSAVLAQWNDTAVPYPREACIHELFAAQARRTPDAVALSAGPLEVTYRALDKRSDRLARHLAGFGVGPDVLVGVFAGRSVELIVGLLAILKAGGAYLPLDPSYPFERLSAMLDDAQPFVVLTSRELTDALPTFFGYLVELETELEDTGGPPPAAAGPGNLAYVMYTSGSTGRPKGVCVEHRAVVRLACGGNFARLGPDVVIFQYAPFSFDASTFEIWGCLLHGGRLVVIPPGVASLSALGQELETHGVNTLWLTTDLFRLMAELQLASLQGVRQLFTGGDVLPVPQVRELLERAPGVTLINCYGPTENTTFTTTYPVRSQDLDSPVPIGRGIGNTTVYVLDARMEPVPVGVAGELFNGGDGLARGYLGDPALTAARFVPHPFADGERLYRTGDRARFRADGALEFLGRVDRQVKVRGYRIELGEVEAALEAHPSVLQAAVLVDARGGDKRLVAYVVPRGDAPEERLRAHLQEKLPPYMMPSGFVFLDRMPLGPTGKVDRKALHGPGETRRQEGAGYEAPRTAVEEVLAELWREVLGAERVGVHDNFFELGGDSILSIQMVARAGQKGLQLTPQDVFQHQTVAELAGIAGEVREDAADEPEAVAGPVELTPIQRWFLDAAEPGLAHHFNQSAWLEAAPGLDPARLEQALAAVVDHHNALRMRYTRTGTEWRQEGLARDEVRLHLVDLGSAGERGLEPAAAAVQASLDLTRGPLMQAVLFDLGPDRPGRFLWVIHHLVVDGVSWRILLEDLCAAYGQLAAGYPPRLPARTTSFQQWARRLAGHARSTALDGERAYWERLSEGEAGLLPRDRPAEPHANRVASEARVRVELDPDRTGELLREVPKAYRTHIQEVLLTALARTVSTWTGRESLRLDLEGHGREGLFDDADLSRTVGWFTSLYPVELTLSPDGGPGADLKRVKEQLRAVPGRGVGYGLLRHSDPGFVLPEGPDRELCFNYLGQWRDARLSGPFTRLLDEPAGPAHSPRMRRRYAIEVVSYIRDGALAAEWVYSRELHDAATIERLARRFREELAGLIEHCLSPRTGAYTPSDFPLASLTQEELDRVTGSRHGVEDVYPLAPLQQGILFHAIFGQGGGLYFEQLSFEVHGEIDRPAFQRAWREVAGRHPALRTSFTWREGREPLQVVHESVELPWKELDWRRYSASERERLLDDFLERDRSRGFALDQAPLLRFTLVRVSEESHRFVWSYHHLLLDGWSVAVVLEEVFGRYEAAERDGVPPLPAERGYRDYIAWLAHQEAGRSEEFWRGELAGADVSTPLGIGGDRGADREQPPLEHEVRLSRPLTGDLRGLARREHLTLSTLAQAAWAFLLARYSGERDVVFGTTVSGRPPELPRVESAVGLFINTLPVRCEVPEREGLVPWMRGLHARQVERERYSFTPLADIQRWSGAAPAIPLFESLLVFENYPLGSLSTLGAELRIDGLRTSHRTNYPLTLILMPGDELSLRTGYDGARFDPATIDRMAAHFQTVLEQIAADPERLVGGLSLLTGAERAMVLERWNDTAVPYPREACLHELFTAQARRAPDAVALAAGDLEVTYRALDERSDRLARHLAGFGVGPDVLVGVFAERSVELIVGLLAILKAGGAYLPLDPSYPEDRLLQMVEDARVPVLLVQPDLSGRLPGVTGRGGPAVVELVPEPEDAGGPSPAAAGPGNLAYVMYTSGSTGRPKGVCVEHRAVVRLACGGDFARLGPGEAILQYAPVSFDASTFEIWGCLLHGGRLALMPPGTASLAALGQALEEHGVTTLWLTADLFRLMAEMQLASLQGVRQLLAGGDVLPVPQVRELLERAPGVTLINGYGPTENTTFTCTHQVRPEDLDDGSAPIGRALGNTTVYVLDARMEPVPVGVAGELFTGGDGLARGYLGDPALTAARFVPHPFADGERLYRTGDRARFRADGALEFLGRVDRQVKVRGYRIELGEVEAALEAHPSVLQAAVLADARGGDKRLVAYVVPRGDAPEERLRAHLQEKLPPYMMPSGFVFLDRMPLGPTGKVDRKALHGLGETRRQEGAGYEAPRTAVEEVLAELWREVLGAERVGVHDNFFELGGDSILSIQMVARAGQKGLQLTPQDLFRHQTVAELAGVLGESRRAQAEQGAVTGPVELTPIQRWFLDAEDPALAHHFNQSLWLEPAAGLDRERLERALAAVVDHHDALRMRYAFAGTERRQEGLARDEVRLHVVDLAGAGARGELEPAAAAIQASLDLTHGPLMRVVLFDFGPGNPGRLLWVIHHLVVDGVSWRILLEDLCAAYQQLAAGGPARLPAKTTSFQHWSRRLAEHSRTAALEAERAFWERLSHGTADRLPRDYETPGAGRVASEARVRVELGERQTGELLREVPKAYRTQIQEVLLTALARCFAEWTGRRSLRLDLEGHGREELFDDLDLSRTVGWFTSLYPVELTLSPDGGPGADLKQVKEQLRAVPNRGVGHGLLRHPPRGPEAPPALPDGPGSEISFNYLGQWRDARLTGPLTALLDEPAGPARSPRMRRRYLLEVVGYIREGVLVTEWVYSREVYEPQTIERLAHGFRDALAGLIGHCLSPEAGGYTPSDFRLAELTQADLDELVADLFDGPGETPLTTNA